MGWHTHSMMKLDWIFFFKYEHVVPMGYLLVLVLLVLRFS